MTDNVFLDVFDVENEEVNLNEDARKESNSYAPKAVSKDKAYVATIRIIPLPLYTEGKISGWKKKNPYHMKKRYYLKDEDGYGTYFDSPITINESCPIQDTFFKLYYSDDVRKQKLAKDRFSISTHYWSLVYIIEDKQKPELEGKVKVFRFTKDIKELIKAEYEDDGVKVWDLKKGKNLKLVVSEKSVKLDNGKSVTFPEYNIGIKTKFVAQGALEIDGVSLDTSSKETQLALQAMYEDAPNISEYEYQPWDNETKEKVNNILDGYLRTFSLKSKSSTQNSSKEDKPNSEIEASNIMDDLDIMDGDDTTIEDLGLEL